MEGVYVLDPQHSYLAIDPAIDLVIFADVDSIGPRGDKLFRVRALPPEASMGKKFRGRHTDVSSALKGQTSFRKSHSAHPPEE